MIYQALIIDDEEIVCRGLTRFVKWKEHGFEVAGSANSVDAALLLLETLHVDVIFMDIRMPEKNGLELLPILKEKYPEIKSVILSGYSDFAYAKEAIRYGVFDYLTKPVNLDEMGQLLDRLHQDFDRQQQQLQVHSDRLEVLLISAAKGYSGIDPQKLKLPTLKSWFALSMMLSDRRISEQELFTEKENMKNHITALIPDSILLDDDVYSLFALLPCCSEKEADTFLDHLEQFCPRLQEWICGISRIKTDICQIHDAWMESGQAMRFLHARSKTGMIRYKNIETLFSQGAPEMQTVLQEALHRLTAPETRDTAILYIRDSLFSICQKDHTFTQYQTTCIRFLTELNGYLGNLELPKTDLHTKLNQTLCQILLCQSYPDTVNCMTAYLEWLVDQLDHSDSQQLGTGVIREIQLFIRQHYAEDISLNTLAEHFYLHSNYLSKLFKDKTGKNFIEYLTEVRMKKAKELLQNTDYKIIDICAMTGYDNPRYFSRLFKQHTQMTPREYRDLTQTAKKTEEKN